MAATWKVGSVLLLLLQLTTIVASTKGVAKTPPMGFNTWTFFGCTGINAQVMIDTANSMKSLGLQDAGYEFVNMDDCWMLKDREDNGNGPQIPNPEKFPQGLQAVIDTVHKLGFKFGLYTAKAPHTCQGYAGACKHEFVDAKQYAEWGVDYLKDDSCGTCTDVLSDYQRMQEGIDITGHPIVLSVEGQPNVTIVSKDGKHGNLRRVGHDIRSTWTSVVTLVDLGSGLWSYAHNDTGNGGWWNDLDMLQIGNGEFNADVSSSSRTMAQSHMTMWCAMKAPLLMGNNLTAAGPETIAILANKEALAVNQDSFGVQARRVLSTPPTDQSWDQPYVVLASCNGSKPTQNWRLVTAVSPTNRAVYLTECNATEDEQRWLFSDGTMENVASKQCVDLNVGGDPVNTAICNSGLASQQWMLDSASKHIVNVNKKNCLDVFGFGGPDLEIGGCKVPGENDSNQQFVYNVTTNQLLSLSNKVVVGKNCVGSVPTTQPFALTTQDASGKNWCLQNSNDAASVVSFDQTIPKACHIGVSSGNVNATEPTEFHFVGGRYPIGWDSTFGASGPLPFTRYVNQGDSAFMMDPSKPGVITGVDGETVILDDNIGGPVHTTTNASSFCLDVTYGGNLEVWTGPLTEGRQTVVFFNRSPSTDSLKLDFSLLGVTSNKSYSIRDIWNAKDLGVFTGSYTATAEGYGTAFLVLTPATE